MAKDTTSTVETFPKATVSRAEVERERLLRLDSGAISSTISEDKDNWILTTVWPVVKSGAKP